VSSILTGTTFVSLGPAAMGCQGLSFCLERINMQRRSFVKALALSSIFGPSALSAETKNSRSIIWLWLGGGASHIETFNPIPDAPVEYRGVTGHVTGKNGIQLGGNFTELSKHTDKISVVRSFGHGDSNHDTGSRWVMTGNRTAANAPTYPNMGSIASYFFGPNNTANGVPNYIREGRIDGDEPAWLGEQHRPFDAKGEGVKSLSSIVSIERLRDRRELLNNLDKSNDYISQLRGQAYNVLLGEAEKAFNIEKEDSKVKESYGGSLGEKLLLARRLTDYGARFVSIHHGGWDHHGSIQNNFNRMGPEIDKAITSLIIDLYESGKKNNVMLVVTGEFGRTPKLNKDAGRDHWPSLTPLMIAGGPYDMGRVIGTSNKKAEVPQDTPYTPKDLMRTLMDYYNIPLDTQKTDNGGRPRYLVEGDSRNILV
jgi:hypothetical protein